MKDEFGKTATWAATLILLVWLAILGYLVWSAGPDVADQQWSRLLTVLGSLETVALAAAGVLLGTSVQRQRVRDAQQQAKEAQQQEQDVRRDKDSFAQAAANGNALAKAVTAYSTTTGEADANVVIVVPKELVEVANKLFPEP